MANEENTNTQWTDTEYSEDAAPQEAYASDAGSTEEEYSETYDNQEGYEEEAGYEDDGYQEQPSAPDSRKPLAVLLFLIILVLICAGIFLLFKQIKSKGASDAGSAPQMEAQQVQDNNSGSQDAFFADDNSSDMGSMSFNDNNADNRNNSQQAEAGSGESISKSEPDIVFDDNLQAADIGEASKSEKEAAMEREQDEMLESFGGRGDDSIMVAWNRAARQNPFRPPVFERSDDGSYEQIGDVQFEIIEPPTRLVPDDNLTKLLQTQISGILYDDESPSAIVNIAGVDQFVKIGDEVSGYKIKNITNSKVEISYKNNTYVASVGELFARGRIEARPAVSNLKNKFAGRYRNENNIEE